MLFTAVPAAPAPDPGFPPGAVALVVVFVVVAILISLIPRRDGGTRRSGHDSHRSSVHAGGGDDGWSGGFDGGGSDGGGSDGGAGGD